MDRLGGRLAGGCISFPFDRAPARSPPEPPPRGGRFSPTPRFGHRPCTSAVGRHDMTAPTHHLAELNVGRRDAVAGGRLTGDGMASCRVAANSWSNVIAVRWSVWTTSLLGVALAVSGCCNVGGCFRHIGEETERGAIEREGRSLGYVYRKQGVPMERSLVRDTDGRKVKMMMPTLYDAGVPLIEIFASGKPLDESDRDLARREALALCERNESWRNDTVKARRLGLSDFSDSDFYDRGVWSFVMVCQ